jgi:hypothetical protein
VVFHPLPAPKLRSLGKRRDQHMLCQSLGSSIRFGSLCFAQLDKFGRIKRLLLKGTSIDLFKSILPVKIFPVENIMNMLRYQLTNSMEEFSAELQDVKKYDKGSCW